MKPGSGVVNKESIRYVNNVVKKLYNINQNNIFSLELNAFIDENLNAELGNSSIIFRVPTEFMRQILEITKVKQVVKKETIVFNLDGSGDVMTSVSGASMTRVDAITNRLTYRVPSGFDGNNSFIKFYSSPLAFNETTEELWIPIDFGDLMKYLPDEGMFFLDYTQMADKIIIEWGLDDKAKQSGVLAGTWVKADIYLFKNGVE